MAFSGNLITILHNGEERTLSVAQDAKFMDEQNRPVERSQLVLRKGDDVAVFVSAMAGAPNALAIKKGQLSLTMKNGMITVDLDPPTGSSPPPPPPTTPVDVFSILECPVRQGPKVQIKIISVTSRSVAEEALTRLRGGADFDALAKELSIDPSAARGGALGEFLMAELKPEFRTALEGCGLLPRPNAVTEVIVVKK